MKKSAILFLLLIANTLMGQQWSTSSNSIYSTNKKVVIGGTTYSGQFGSDQTLLQ